MSSFTDDINRFRAKLEKRRQDIFVGVCLAVLESIQIGSAITGAPGQPVDTGALRASWQLTFEDVVTALISTNLVYAAGIEDGIGPHGEITLRSATGGFHSVKITRAGFDKIVEDVTRKVVGNDA